jgi:hypothetical protein
MNKKGLFPLEKLIKILVVIGVLVVIMSFAFPIFGGEGGLLNQFLKMFGTSDGCSERTLEELEEIVAEYETYRQREDIIEELIFYREKCPKEKEKIEFLEVKAFEAYNILYGDYFAKIREPNVMGLTPLARFPFCKKAIRYYEVRDDIFEDFAGLHENGYTIAKAIDRIAQYCYNIHGLEYFCYSYYHKEELGMNESEYIVDIENIYDQREICKCYSKNCPVARDYFVKAEEIDEEPDFTKSANEYIKKINAEIRG